MNFFRRSASIKTKLILIFIFISLAPIIAVSFLFFEKTRENFQEQTTRLLILAADMAEGHILTFFERQKVRTQDWSSDGHIRTETEAIAKTGDARRAAELSVYLKNKKIPLDKTVAISEILDLSGRVIASSEEKRAGHVEPDLAKLDREYRFIQAKNASFGQTFVSEIISEKEGHPEKTAFHVSVPIISFSTNEVAGILVNHVQGEELNKIISGKMQMELGALTGGGPNYQTLETYLVNYDGLMITPSRFVADAILKQKAFSDPVRACLEDGREISGRYKNYRGAWVYGASMCPQNQFWMLLTEIEENEILASFKQMARIIFGIVILIVALVTLLAVFWGRRLAYRILAVARAVAEIGRGNLKTRISAAGGDEISQLGLGINQMADDLEKNIEQIKSLDALKQKFIQIVSHQLRTPLNVIRWNLEMMMDEKIGKLTEEQRDFIQVIHEADIEVIRRIADLLTALDIEEGRVVFRKESASLESLFSSVLLEFKKECEIKEIICEYEPSKAPLPLIAIDAVKIRDVFSKLMENAVAYTAKKGKIIAKLLKIDSWLRFEITDTGIGIPAAEQNRIFTRFYRATNAFPVKSDASGIGLAITKYYIEQHGGKVGFKSKEGKGSVFWFELPLDL